MAIAMDNATKIIPKINIIFAGSTIIMIPTISPAKLSGLGNINPDAILTIIIVIPPGNENVFCCMHITTPANKMITATTPIR